MILSIENKEDITKITFSAPREKIAYYRFILESYDNLGIQTTEAGSNIITWSVPDSQLEEARQLLNNI